MDRLHVPPETREPNGLADAHAFSAEDRAVLRKTAEKAIRRGLEGGKPLELDPGDHAPALRAERAAFVTLNRGGQLRGCVGSMAPRRTLVEDVAHNAHGAAFRDPRFPALRREEMDGLEIHISVLSPLELLQVRDRDHLLEVLEPGLDGLLLEDPPHRSTFLPQVWSSLPDPEDFLTQLFLKAGLSPAHWSTNLTFHRYTVTEI